jgi:hypothetical protein
MSVMDYATHLFKRRHFDRFIIVLCVRWYVSYKLSYRDLYHALGPAVGPGAREAASPSIGPGHVRPMLLNEAPRVPGRASLLR